MGKISMFQFDLVILDDFSCFKGVQWSHFN